MYDYQQVTRSKADYQQVTRSRACMITSRLPGSRVFSWHTLNGAVTTQLEGSVNRFPARCMHVAL